MSRCIGISDLGTASLQEKAGTGSQDHAALWPPRSPCGSPGRPAVLVAELSPNFLHAELSARGWRPNFLVVLRVDKWWRDKQQVDVCSPPPVAGSCNTGCRGRVARRPGRASEKPRPRPQRRRQPLSCAHSGSQPRRAHKAARVKPKPALPLSAPSVTVRRSSSHHSGLNPRR